MEVELTMKYILRKDECEQSVIINKAQEGLNLTIGEVSHNVRIISRKANELVVDLGFGPERLIYDIKDDTVEIYFRENNYSSDVYNERKIALRMMDFAGGNEVLSPMTGRIFSITVAVGDQVNKGDVVAIVEAMKMENPMKSPRDGVVKEILVSEGDVVEAKSILLTLEND
jgi:biotin carboxyl carrier protein